MQKKSHTHCCVITNFSKERKRAFNGVCVCVVACVRTHTHTNREEQMVNWIVVFIYLLKEIIIRKFKKNVFLCEITRVSQQVLRRFTIAYIWITNRPYVTGAKELTNMRPIHEAIWVDNFHPWTFLLLMDLSTEALTVPRLLILSCTHFLNKERVHTRKWRTGEPPSVQARASFKQPRS